MKRVRPRDWDHKSASAMLDSTNNELNMDQPRPMRRKAFTLVEMLVVIAIIVLMVVVGVPVIRTLVGSNSTSVTRNELASLMAHAREQAVAVQDVRGVLFVVDPVTDRVSGMIVQAATLQDPAFSNANGVLLDLLQGNDAITFPPGIRIQTIFNGLNYSTSATQNDDRYLGFNRPQSLAATSPSIGGCILFDGYGKLVTRPYGLQMKQVDNSNTNVAKFLGFNNV